MYLHEVMYKRFRVGFCSEDASFVSLSLHTEEIRESHVSVYRDGA